MEHEERLKAALSDSFQIEREIGSGGMATVYLAQDLKHHRQVAVKVLDSDLAQTLGAERFLREIQTAANLTHPHILPLFDSGEAEGFLFYVMPFVKGESLRSRLTKEKQLPVEDAIQITREIADALAYAHREGVIHRDVKPANIMLDEGHAVLADFGVAHAVAEAKVDRITRTGTSLGTPAYMSPEQATGELDLDGRSDQYALGCVLYEMLAGHPPFTGAQVEAVVRQHLTEDPPSVTQARPSVAEEVVKVINRALAKSPADRFKTTGEMAAALALTTTPVQKALGPLSKPVGIGLVLAALLVVAGVALNILRQEDQPTSPDPSPAAQLAAEQDQAGSRYRASVAVFPFESLGREEHGLLGHGIAEEINAQLTQVLGLKVISRTSVGALEGVPLTTPEIADTLGVSHILEGTFQAEGDSVVVTVQLIEASTDAHIWAETYYLSLEGVFSLRDKIARQVTLALVESVPDLRGPGAHSRIGHTDAYESFLRGTYSLKKRTRQAILDAIAAFEETLRLDPGFALAYAGLASAHGLWVSYGYPGGLDHYRAAARSIAYANLAIALGPDAAEGYSSRAYVMTKAGAPAAVVHRDFDRAPSSAKTSFACRG